MAAENKKQWLGVVLAGGESRRFGEPKAFVRYEGHYFYEYSIRALVPFTDEVVIISHPSLTNQFSRQSAVQVMEDAAPYCGKGPLAGLYSVMKKFKANWYIVLPCDMPLVNKEVTGRLAAAADQAYDAVIPNIAGRMQPLVGVYHQRVFSIVTKQLSDGNYRMLDFLQKINVKQLTEVELQSADNWFENINTKDAYSQLFADGSSDPLY
ncbi:molybdenum cofactor guanylyltransferase [Bacillus sp. B190/17]|uniref:Probable molybdenum cofactor guanylyltransferase n=1 Tax=Bacillus lumedeiriae TaxID=3058829 RepID=A0ABW8IBR2_9BACI